MAIEVVGPDGTILEFPEGTSREVMRAAMAKRYPKNAAAPKPKAKAKPKKSFLKRAEEFGEAALTGVAEGIRPVSEFAQRLDPTRPVFEAVQDIVTPGARQANERRFRQQVERVKRESPNTFTGGKIVGEIVATAPIAGAAGAGIKAVGGKLATRAPAVGRSLQRVGRAVQTGGLGTGRTAAQTAALSKGARAAQLAERMAGGAISGAITTGAVGGDVGEGALFGAGLPVAANIVKRLGGKGVDLLRAPKLKAAEIIREALGKDVEATRQVLSQLSPDDQRLAQQVILDAGLEPRAFFGIGKSITEQVDPDTTARVLAQQAAAREAALADISGGATATQRRGAAETSRRAVTEATGPARDAALERANVAGRVVPEAERLASAALSRADELTASGFVPRMRGLEERASEQARIMGDTPAIFPDMERIQQTRGVAGAAGTRANQSIRTQIGLRGVARDMEDLVADMAAEGMQPLQVAPIVGQLRSMAGQPGTRADKLQRSTLTRLANELESLADVNGVIDARDLYQIRKTGLNDIVDRLLGARAQPSSGTKERTASLLTSIRPMIDEAVESAGGQGWKDYLVRTRQGFEAVNRQELASKGAQLAKENPNEFIALMGGERPQIVEDVMGKGTKQYDIGGMALMDPRRYNTMMNASRELQSLNRMRELGTEGSARAADIMRAQQPGLMERGVGLLLRTKFPALSFATSGAQNIETATLSPRVRERLANAFVSGPGMREAMEQYPTAFNISEQVSRAPAGLRNVMAQGLVRPITADFPEIDPETGEILLEVGFNEDGSTYPIYGRPPAR
jgi:hypothetical protein